MLPAQTEQQPLWTACVQLGSSGLCNCVWKAALPSQTAAGQQSALPRNQTSSQQTPQISFWIWKAAQNPSKEQPQTVQAGDVSSLSVSLVNAQFAAARVCQTTQQVITHLNQEEPDGQKSFHKEFHTAVVKALRSNPNLLAEASGIANMVQLGLWSKEQPLDLHHLEILSIDSHLWDWFHL